MNDTNSTIGSLIRQCNFELKKARMEQRRAEEIVDADLEKIILEHTGGLDQETIEN